MTDKAEQLRELELKASLGLPVMFWGSYTGHARGTVHLFTLQPGGHVAAACATPAWRLDTVLLLETDLAAGKLLRPMCPQCYVTASRMLRSE